MKTKSIFVLGILLIFISSFSANSQNPAFSGEWKLNTEKTILPDNGLFLSKITIQLQGDSLLTNRVYENGNGEEYSFDENLSLDGKDCKITIYDMPRISKANQVAADGTISVESKTTFTGDDGTDDLLAKETWSVENEGNTLIIDFTNKMTGNETHGKNYYNKVK